MVNKAVYVSSEKAIISFSLEENWLFHIANYDTF